MNTLRCRLLVPFCIALLAIPVAAQSPFVNGVASIPLPGQVVERRDVNGDGVPDLVFTTILPRASMGYLPGIPDWGFGEASLIYNLGSPGGTQIGFFEPSSPLTAVVLQAGRNIFYQDIDGVTIEVARDTWPPLFRQVSGAPFGVRQFMADDLDGDGLTELLYPTASGFAIRWSNRQPFTRYQEFFLGGSVFVFPLDDYDNDGFNDVLVHSVQQCGVMFYRGGPIDKLGAPLQTHLLIDDIDQLAQFAKQVGFFDDDPAIDVVFADSDQATFHLNFLTDHASTVVLPLPAGSSPDLFPVGDHDRDGWGDLFFEVPSTFAWSHRTFLWRGPLSPSPQLIEFEGHANLETFAVFSQDIDADDRPDLVTISRDYSALQSRDNLASPILGPTVGPANGATRHTLSIDLDGDGLPELLNSAPLQVLNPRDLQQPAISLGVSGGFMSLSMGSSPQGGVRIAHDGDALRILDFAPDGTLAETTVLDLPAPGSVIGLAKGDFDGDGLEDLATIRSPADAAVIDEMLIYRGLANGSFEFFVAVPSPDAIKPAVGDFDGDGLADIFVGDRSAGTVRVLLNRGKGVFETSATWSTSAAYWLDALDVDGDGHVDVVGLSGSKPQNSSLPSAAVWYGRPDGVFENPQAVHFLDPLVEPAFGDLDGNGLLDMVFGISNFNNPYGSAGFVYIQTAPRVFELRASLPRGDASSVAIADFNADGLQDIAAVSGELRRTRVFWGQPAPCPADFNADGQLNFFDLARFAQAFAAGDLSADIAEPFGVWNFFDVSAYVGLFNAGCP